MGNCGLQEGQLGYDHETMYNTIRLLYDESLKPIEKQIIYDDRTLDEALERFLYKPFEVRDIIDELLEEGFVNINYSEDSGKPYYTISENGAYEYSQYIETEDYKAAIKKANETMGRNFNMGQLLEFRMNEFTHSIIYDFFVSFAYDLRDKAR